MAPVSNQFAALDPDSEMELPPYSLTLLTWEQSARHAWRYQHFGTVSGAGNAGDAADPDSDGIPNFLEYATGRNPLAAESLPLCRLETLTPESLDFVFRRERAELTYAVETSTDLVTWSAQSPNQGSPGSEVHVSLEPGPGGRIFARLRVREVLL